ncbi:MAG: hypothetical protein VXZ19_06140, partial [Pseudomonadota bacterium]|nr:hypothetical protein [Pseudomonadota bacterium]
MTVGSFMLLAGLSSHVRGAPAVSNGTFAYEARMGLLIAGELTFDFHRRHDTYDFLGQFQTSRSLSAYYN